MAISNNTIFENNLDSNCTESFLDDIDIVVDRRINYILQKTKFNVNILNATERIKKAKKHLNDLIPTQSASVMDDFFCAHNALVVEYVEAAYKQGFKDAMSLMFITNN